MTQTRENRPSDAEAASESVVATQGQDTAPVDHLSRLDTLWNTSELNPAVKARQERSARETQFMIDNSPGYARELAELKAWLTDYDAPNGGA